ncbi:MAG TPA: hypothetical protein VFV87_20125, partial [Pirellulaceae bacterium]|nr:hypothetical protein [Pirellulaceae bacterium]
SGQADSLVSIEIYSEEQIRIASDARTMNLEELGKKYQHVGEQAAKALAEYKASLEAQRERNSRFDFPPQGEPVVSLGEDRTVLLCTVAHVGDDYVLVSYGDENPRKQVFAKQAIARIRWATGDLRFRTAVRRNENRE